MTSTEHPEYLTGREIEPGTKLNIDAIDGDMPHHYFTEQEMRELVRALRIVRLEHYRAPSEKSPGRIAATWAIYATAALIHREHAPVSVTQSDCRTSSFHVKTRGLHPAGRRILPAVELRDVWLDVDQWRAVKDVQPADRQHVAGYVEQFNDGDPDVGRTQR